MLCLFNLGTGEIVVIVLVILLLFGAKRIPELARGLGQGIRQFKQGMNDAMNEPDKKPKDSAENKDSDTEK